MPNSDLKNCMKVSQTKLKLEPSISDQVDVESEQPAK